MPPVETLAAFLATIALLAFLPGPSMLYAAAQTLARGRDAGLMAALGIHLGGYAHVAAAAAGLSVLFHTVPLLYLVTKLAGAAYLVWLGIGMWRRRLESDPRTVRAPTPARNPARAFLHSVLVEVLNPKSALFFLAFLPQFVDAGAAWPLWVQFLVLGTAVNWMFSLADCTCVLLAGAMVARLRQSTRAQRTLQRLGGGALVGLGTHLALQRG